MCEYLSVFPFPVTVNASSVLNVHFTAAAHLHIINNSSDYDDVFCRCDQKNNKKDEMHLTQTCRMKLELQL